MKALVNTSVRTARRIVIGIVGTTVCLIGVALLVLPGPAFVVIPAGLAILSIEFAFARRWLKSLRRRISDTMQKKRMSKK
ncbi:MAG: PGPGW domain-containing protein [Gammaproteobacteria bacterium]